MRRIATAFIFIALVTILHAQDATEANLKKYKDLYDKGLISQSDYENLKKKALGLGDAPTPTSESNTTNNGTKRDLEEVRAFLEKKVTAESKGLLKLLSFTKTDGASRIVDGQNWYDMWFTIEIQPTKGQVYKPENRVGMPVPQNGIWSNFQVTTETNLSLGQLLDVPFYGEGEVYRGNNAIKLTGYSESFITETGWKNNKIRFSKEERLNVDRITEIERQKNAYVPIDKANETEIGPQFEEALTSNLNWKQISKVADIQKTYDNKEAVDLSLKKLVGKWKYTNTGIGFFEGIKISGVIEFDANGSYGKFTTTIDNIPDLPKFSTLKTILGKSEMFYCNVVYNDRLQTFIIEQRGNGPNANMTGKAKYYLKFQGDMLTGKSLFFSTDHEFGVMEANKQ